MAEVESLVAKLSLDMRAFRSEMLKAQGVSTKAARDVESAWARTNGKLNAFGKSMASGLAAPLAAVGAAASVKEVAAYADSWSRAKSLLASTASVTGRQVKSMDDLYEVANRTRTGLNETIDLYAKLTRATATLNVSTDDVAKATETIQQAFKASGASSAEAASGVLQLSQALSSGALQGDELRSLRENAPLIAQAIADEFGTTIGGLKKLGAEGALTADRVFLAIQKAAPKIQAAFGATNQTIADGVTKINNAFARYIGSTDESLGASQRLVQGLNALADNFDNIADTTVRVAGIIAAAFVGRSIGGMINKLGLAVPVVMRFIAALRAAQGMSGLAVTLGGIGAAAGPLGAAIGLVTGALIAFGTTSGGATDAAGAYTEALNKLDEAAVKAADSIEKVKAAQEKIARTREAVSFGTQEIEDIQAALASLFDTLQSAPDRLISESQKKSLAGLQDDLKTGKKSADEVKAALIEMGGTSEAIAGLTDEFASFLDQLTKALKATGALKGELATLQASGITDGGRALGFQQLGARDAAAKAQSDFLTSRDAEARRTENEKAIDARAKEIVKAGNEIGVAITEAAAKIQAAGEIAAEQAAKSATSAAGVIKGFEGFSAKAYYDVNAYRAGYGSDTVTLSDGSIRAVVQGMTVTLADAERDLARRIGEFQDGIKSKIGADTFNSMSQNQQDALTSIAYNYGSLPERIVEAIKTGNEGAIYTAIRGLGSDNGGVNRKRRNAEADLFANGANSPSITAAQDAGKSAEDFATRIQQQREFIAALQAETAIRGTLNPLVKDYGKATETLKAGQELLTEAQKQGIEAGKELKDVQQLLYGDLSGLSEKAREQALAMRELAIQTGTAEAAGLKLSEAQDRLAESMRASSEFGKDVLGGLIRDLRDGKSGAEALANAFDKIADKLLDVALNSLFGLGPGGNGGGPLSGIFGFLGKLLGFASGTPNTGGKRGQPVGIVHGQEAVIPLGASGEVPVVVKTPQAPAGRARGGAETITVVLQDDSGRMADIANTQIKTHAGTIVKVATQQAVGQVRRGFPSLLSEAQMRKM